MVSAVSAGYKTYVGTDKSAAYPIYCDELKSEIESFNPSFSQEGPNISGMAKNQKKGMTKSRNLFLKIYKKVDDGTMAELKCNH